jgi:bacterioferritin
MKGNEKVLEKLNELLADELTAINQYMVHSEMAADWGFERLHESIEKRAIDEMKHAEALIGRILFLEGIPIVSELKSIHIGAKVEKQFNNDWKAEYDAIQAYNEAIKLACSSDDHGTEGLLKSILKDEEDHIDWLESQKELIEQIGIQNYLTEQVKEDEEIYL